MKQVTQEDMVNKCHEVSELLKHLAHPGRLMLLCLMKDDEYTVTQLSQKSGMSTSAVSQALGKMYNAHLITKQKSGVETFYTICSPKLFKMMHSMSVIFGD
ncbi:MAG: metalloregulator ArsR/SmtB family transcription factor [Lentisphaerales bacterium]|nr:metalloregulator ArsR/SmtB family transcription factor [Lentisphaerales bacterium]